MPRLAIPSTSRVLRRTTALMVNSAPGPQRDYYLAVRMEIMRNPDHGYRICRMCGDPYLPRPGNHERVMDLRATRYRRHAA